MFFISKIAHILVSEPVLFFLGKQVEIMLDLINSELVTVSKEERNASFLHIWLLCCVQYV